MGEKTLVDGLTDDTESLVAHLDDSDRQCSLVTWYFYPDSNEWKLLLAGKWLNDFLPNQEAVAYQKIAQAITELELSNLSVSSIKLLGKNNQLIGAISMLVGTGFGPLGHMHFSGTSLNGIYIDEMLIMRSAPNATAA